MFGRRCVDQTALLFLSCALAGCSVFEAPTPFDGGGAMPQDAGQDSGGDQPADADVDAVVQMEDAGSLPAGNDGGSASVDASITDSAVDAGEDAAVVMIPKRPMLAKCGFAAPITTGSLTYAGLNEVSGLAVSRKNARVIWMIEDSGNGAQVHAMNDQGTLVASYSVSGNAVDYEDIAIGPGPVAGESYLYIADIGDNNGIRANIAVYRAPEPTVAWDQTFATGALSMVEPFPMQYASGHYNAEALMVDTNQDIYLVTKDGFTRPNTLYRLSAPQMPATLRTLEAVGALFGGTGTDVAITGGDMSADGQQIIVRTLRSATYWQRAPGASVADTMLTGTPCDAELATEDKGESISFSSDGYYTISEGVSEPLHFVKFTP